MRYYRISDGALIDITAEQFAALAPVKQALHRPYSVAPPPVLTPTQKAVVGPIAYTDSAATHTWIVVEKTQAEKDEDTEAAQRAIDYADAKAVYLNLKNGVGTAAERLTRIEKVLARLLRDALLSRGL